MQPLLTKGSLWNSSCGSTAGKCPAHRPLSFFMRGKLWNFLCDTITGNVSPPSPSRLGENFWNDLCGSNAGKCLPCGPWDFYSGKLIWNCYVELPAFPSPLDLGGGGWRCLMEFSCDTGRLMYCHIFKSSGVLCTVMAHRESWNVWKYFQYNTCILTLEMILLRNQCVSKNYYFKDLLLTLEISFLSGKYYSINMWISGVWFFVFNELFAIMLWKICSI